MPGHVWYFAAAIVYFDSPGHSRVREDPEKLRVALQEELNRLLKGKTFRAASEHTVDSIEVNKVGATLQGVARAIDEERGGRSPKP